MKPLFTNQKSVFDFISKSDILKIIVVSSLMYVILHFVRITLLISGKEITFFEQYMWNKVSLAPTWKEMLFQPWSIVTYMFTELSFMRLLGNMIWLWIFGSVIEDLQGQYKVLPIYLTGGIMGGILMLCYQSFSNTPSIFYAGGLAALVSVAISTVLFNPRYKFWLFGSLGVPIWLLFVVFLALNLSSIGTYNMSLIFMLFGGILTGALHRYVLASYFDGFSILLKRVGDFFGNNENFILERKNTKREKIIQQTPFKVVDANSKRIDMILDKINEKGIESLHETERKILEEYSKKV